MKGYAFVQKLADAFVEPQSENTASTKAMTTGRKKTSRINQNINTILRGTKSEEENSEKSETGYSDQENDESIAPKRKRVVLGEIKFN